VIWAAHRNPEVVVATKIEHVREASLHLLKQEAAYYRWIDRGCPLGQAEIDWTLAEGDIPVLD
jgi:hypothetical protein